MAGMGHLQPSRAVPSDGSLSPESVREGRLSSNGIALTAHERSDVRALRSLETEFLPMAPMQPAVGPHSLNRAVHRD